MITLSPLRQDSLDEYLDGIPQLPPAPPLLFRLIELFRQTDGGANQVVKSKQEDCILAAAVLQRCNRFFWNEATPGATQLETFGCAVSGLIPLQRCRTRLS